PAQLLAVGDVPQADVPVLTSGRQGRAVGGEGEAVDGAVVPFERAHFLAGERVPQADAAVGTAGREHPAVRRESHAPGPGAAEAQGAEAADRLRRQRVAVAIDAALGPGGPEPREGAAERRQEGGKTVGPAPGHRAGPSFPEVATEAYAPPHSHVRAG